MASTCCCLLPLTEALEESLLKSTTVCNYWKTSPQKKRQTMVVFSKLLVPIDEDSHKPQQQQSAAAANEDTDSTTDGSDESIHPVEDVNLEETLQVYADETVAPRDQVMDELTKRLSITFRLEEKIIETVSSSPDEDKEETPATSSSSSSCSASQSSLEEVEEKESPAKECQSEGETHSTPLLPPQDGQAPQHHDSLANSSSIHSHENVEEKKDDSHDAHALLARLEAESQQSAQQEIEHILLMQRDGVAEANTPIKSNVRSPQKLSIEALDQLSCDQQDGSNSVVEPDREEYSDGSSSLGGFVSAKEELSVPTTPERMGDQSVEQDERFIGVSAPEQPLEESLLSEGESFAMETDKAARLVDELHVDLAVTEIAESQGTIHELFVDDELVAKENDEDLEETEPHALLSSLSVDDEVLERDGAEQATYECQLASTGSGADQSAIEIVMQAESPATQALMPPSSISSSPLSQDAALLESTNELAEVSEGDCTPPRGIKGAQLPDNLLEKEWKPSVDSIPKETNADVDIDKASDVVLEARMGQLLENVHGSDSQGETSTSDMAHGELSLEAVHVLSSCISDDSGVLDPIDAGGVCLHDDSASVTSSPATTPGRKRKGFFGKLKKKLTQKEGSPPKVNMTLLRKNNTSDVSLQNSPCEQEVPPRLPDLGTMASTLDSSGMQTPQVERNLPMDSFEFADNDDGDSRSLPQNRRDQPLFCNDSPGSNCQDRLNDSSILITPASQLSSGSGPVDEISILSQTGNSSLAAPKRRLSVRASHEVAHVFRPPRSSSSITTPVPSRTASPHPSQGPSPGSSQLSSSSSAYNGLQMRPHLPAFAGVRESFILPPQHRKESATRVMTRLIRKDLWSHDSAQVESALLYLADVASDPEKVALIARTGGLLAIVNCMEQHTMHAGIQVAACKALEKLALDSDNELAIGEVGGLEAIQGAMMTHFGDTRVQEAAWAALWNLSCGNADCGSLNHGGLVACMTRHADDAQVQRNACGTLANLCLDDGERLTALAHAGGFVAMATALEKFWRDDDVKNEAAHALVQLLGPAAESYEVPTDHVHMSSSNDWTEEEA
ncbi:hypothetical protein MPSEU_000077900 [Mayamaea pseudoterrestris]|nr:hypothetical protein MPSEU_000077900 [Mayamaea pseudoterrestris]